MRTTVQNILEIRDIYVKYGQNIAVNGISFSVKQGEVFGFLGPNGAGKTTTLSVIEGLLKPTAGKVMFQGKNIVDSPAIAKANMGIQLQKTSFQPELTVGEIITLYSGLYGIDLDSQKVVELLTNVGLDRETLTRRLDQLSGGQQQRVSLIVTTLHNPQLVLLDEPTTGLDPEARRLLWKNIERVRAEGRSVILTTHSMEEAQAMCDRIAIMNHGRIIALDTPTQLITKHQNDPRVLALSHGSVTLEDVFISLTSKEV